MDRHFLEDGGVVALRHGALITSGVVVSLLASLTATGTHQKPLRASRRAGVVAAVVAVLASYSVVGPVSSARAASLTGSDFEIDTNANLTVQGAGSAKDWLSGAVMRTGVMVRQDTPSGGSDNSFTTGTHEDSAVPDVDSGSIPPNKSDLKAFGLYVERTGTKVFLNVFWTRVQDPSGTTNMDFEFNQSAVMRNDPTGSPQIIPVRTVGDLLLTYDLENGGTVATISKRFWLGTQWGPEISLSAAQALGSVNTSAIAAGDSGGLGALDARTFGEASVDLAVLLPVNDGCRTYGSAYLKSRSSASFNAALKDFIAPQAVDISNCGAVKVHKTDANGPLQGAGFTLYVDAVPTGGTRGAEDTTVAGTCTTDSAGDCTIEDVKIGNYWLHESVVPAGHDPVADRPVRISSGDEVVSFALDDPIQTGTITVTKDADPDDAQDFTFTLGTQAFSLDDDSDATLPASRTFTVPVGTHTLTETAIPSGWSLASLTCSPGVVVNGATATITLAKDQRVACTYLDRFTPLDVQLSTQASTAGAGLWNDTASLTGDGTHAVTGNVRFYACAAAAVPTACTSGGTQVGAVVPVTHVSGTSYTAATTTPWSPVDAGWTCFRAVYTSSSGFYASSSHTNTTTECFLKQAADLTVSKTAHAAFGRLYTWTVDKAVDDTTLEVPAGATATSAYTVTVRNRHVDSAWTVNGTITVTNPNPVAFTGVTVTDAIDNGAGSCVVTGGTNVTVPAGGTKDLAYACTYATAPSPSTGTNTATVSWNAGTFFTPSGTASGTASVDFSRVTPSTTDEVVSVDDSVQGSLGTLDARTAANPTVFRYTVDRSGVPGTCTPYDNTARVIANDSESTTTSSARVTVCVGADLTAGLTGSASKDRDDLWRIAKRVDQTRVALPAGQAATFTYEVEVTPAGSVEANHALTGTVTATNPNDWQSVTAAMTVTTTVGGGATCTVTGGTGVVVPASGSISRPFACTFTGAPASSGQISATVTWSAAAASTPTGSAGATSGVTFTLASETHRTVTVVDDKTDPTHPVTLGVWNHGEGAHTYRYTVELAGVPGQCRDYTNTASLTETGQSASRTVTVCVGLDLTISKTALTTDHRTYLWSLAKDVDRTTASIAAGGAARFAYTVTATPAGSTDDGWSVTGQIVLSNPNLWQAVTAAVTDVVDSGGGASCLVGGGSEVVVPAGSSVTLDYRCTFTAKPVDGTNTATATWDARAFATPHGSASGTAAVVFVPTSATNQTITVVDDKTDPTRPVTLGTATWGESPTVFRYTVDTAGVPGACTDLTNTAVITQTQQSASKLTRVCVGQDLTAAVTAAGSFDRDHLWLVAKDVDRTTATVADGQSVDFSYTVTATPGETADSGWALGGTVTVVNPNAWQDVPATTTVTTDLGGGAVCSVVDGVSRTVPAGGSLVLAYECVFTEAPASTGTVAASAVWDAAAASTPLGTAASTAPVTLVLDQAGHETVTVVDDQTDPSAAVTLGSATWSQGPTVFTYTLAKTAVGGTCDTWTNVATIVETEQSATADVELCGTEFTGGGGGPVVNPPPPSGGGGGLVFTGDWTGLMVRWALALLLGGAALMLLGRRRQA